MAKIQKEVEMYEPVKKKLEQMGCTVRSEIKDCDIVAMRGEEMIIVEMKKSFNITVVYQAMDRRSITPNVYVAIPRPSSLREKSTRMMLRLLNELGIGLITVGNNSMRNVDIWVEPKSSIRVNKKRTGIVKAEFEQRTEDRNIGGSTGKKLVTAYTEASVLALCHMEIYDKMRISDIKKFGYPEKMKNALHSNAFGWFERSGRYDYGMSEKGVEALDSAENRDLVEFYRNEVYKNVQDRQK